MDDSNGGDGDGRDGDTGGDGGDGDGDSGGTDDGSGGTSADGGTPGSGGVDDPGLGGIGGTGLGGIGGMGGTTANTGGDASTGGAPPEPNPWACVVGEADDCCPPTITRGGTDPDCPDLSCTLQLAPEVTTFDDWRSSSYGMSGVGLAWTGDYLAVARLVEDQEAGPNPSNDYAFDLVLEKRDTTGQEIAAAEKFPELSAIRLVNGPGALAYHDASDTFFFSYHTYPVSRGVAFSSSAEKLWNAQTVSQCSGINARHMVRATPTGFVAGYRQSGCSGGQHSGIVERYDLLGNRTTLDLVTDYTWEVDYGCNEDCSEILAYANSGDPDGWLWQEGADPEITSIHNTRTTSSIYGNPNTTGVAYDGEKYIVLGNEEAGYENDTLYINFFDPVEKTFSWSTDQLTLGRTGWPMSVIWTGSGFVAAIPSPDTSSTSTLPDRDTSDILIVQIATDGTIINDFWLEAHQGVLPQVELAGDRVAISWVRTGPQSGESRHLGFLECPPDP